ncbi:variant surface glycoprotein (VSG, atypical), putative [Trypanosoma equiperdum]|uniref:Variant surface glycoprotein (VSG, atypical), putative n=1 Tax=Trypanosoma equiperdum TaxID=5694 RepID=A0A1G4I2A2_TRYEQ|nr:variant surface glycoprotein (VSG, atypical), putative [Trypanosoma equiperdum]
MTVYSTAARTSPSEASPGCKTACRCAHRVTNLEKYCDATIKAASRQLAANSLAIGRLLAAAATAGDAVEKTLTPLLAKAPTKLQDQLQESHTASEDILMQLQHFSAMRAQYYAISNLSTSTKTAAAISGDDTNYSKSTVTGPTWQEISNKECSGLTADNTAEVTAATLSKKQGLETTLHYNGQLACYRTNEGSRRQAVAASDKIGVKISVGEKYPGTDEPPLGSGAFKRFGKNKVVTGKITPDITENNMTALAAAAGRMENPQYLTKIASYKQDALFKRLLAIINFGVPPDSKLTGDLERQVKSAIDTTYGKTDKEFQDKIWRPLDEQDSSYYSSLGVKSDKIKSLTSDEQMAGTIAWLLINKISAKQSLSNSNSAQCAKTMEQEMIAREKRAVNLTKTRLQSAQAKNKKNAQMAANGKKTSARIPVFSSIRTFLW